jgi:drug/metabolite transporter (DMT)-like permease
VKVRPAIEVGTHAYVNPFVAVFIGVIFGHEQVTWIQFAGLLVILLSVMLVNINRNRNIKTKRHANT